MLKYFSNSAKKTILSSLFGSEGLVIFSHYKVQGMVILGKYTVVISSSL